MNTGKIVLGTLAGLAIGAIAGILFAPKKGSKTRKLITDKGEEYVDVLKSYTEKLWSTKNDIEEFVDKEKAKFESAKKDVKKAVKNLKHLDTAHN